MIDKTRRDALMGCAALSSLALGGCSDRSNVSAGRAAASGPRLVGKDELTPLERQFGIGPSLGAAQSGTQFVKLRPDVHVVEQGPKTIRAMHSNGLQWTLDPKMTGPIETGRVLLVTNRCAGRVLATRPAGDQIEVVLGPVDLTDYIEKANISLQQPVDFSQALQYEAPDYPGAVTKVGASTPSPAAWGGHEPHASHAIWNADQGHGEIHQVDYGDDFAEDARFKVTPFLDVFTLGVQITSLNDVVQMLGDVRLKFSKPEIHFELKMDESKILQAIVTLTGAAALLVTFRAHSNRGVHGNTRTRHFVPVDCCIPIAGFVVPFAATMRHLFLLETAFSSKGNIDAQGQYQLSGALQMSFGGNSIQLAAPGGFSVQRSLAKSLSGVSMGPAGLNMAHQVRAIVGIGAWGFVTGPFVALTTTAAVTKGSSAGMHSEQCRETTLRMTMFGGVGYSIPRSVANAINFVLGIFHVKGIQAEGGFRSPDQGIVNATEHYPDLKACQSTAGT